MNKVVKYHDKENMLIQIFFPYNGLQNTSEFETPHNFRRNKPPFSVLHNPLTIKQLAIKMNQAQKQVSIKQGYHQGQPMLGKQNQIHQALVINQG